MVIDIHAHTSSHTLVGLHTASASIEELERCAAAHGISKTVLMATSFPLKRSGLSNATMLQRIQGKPLFEAFGTMNLEAGLNEDSLNELIQHLALKRLAGIKLYPGYQLFAPSDPSVFPVYELARYFMVPVMFHGGELHGCCPRDSNGNRVLRCGLSACPLPEREQLARPSAMTEAFRAFPTVRFVVSHLGNPYFQELREVMITCPNVMTDISGQFLSASAEDTPEYRELIVSEIRQFLDLPKGISRVMFGTDFPIQSYEDSFDLVHRLRLCSEDEEMVLGMNAATLLERRPA